MGLQYPNIPYGVERKESGMKKLIVLKDFEGDYHIYAGTLLKIEDGWKYIAECEISTLLKLGYVQWQEEEDELESCLKSVSSGFGKSYYKFQAQAVRKFFREKVKNLINYKPVKTQESVILDDVLKLFEERE